MAFEHRLRVRFHEVDRAGIVFFGRIFEYCHVAFEELLRAMEVTSVFESEGWGMPLVHAEADFRAPMRMGEELCVKVEVLKRSRGTVSFAFQVVGVDDDVLRAEVQHIHAFVTLTEMTPTPFPATLERGLERLDLLP